MGMSWDINLIGHVHNVFGADALMALRWCTLTCGNSFDILSPCGNFSLVQ